MKDVQLVRLDPSVDASLAADPAYMDAMVSGDWSRVADVVHRRVGRELKAVPVSIDELGWGGYFVVDAATRVVVGSCAFKGEPASDGTVEIAYLTYPEFEGKGYATAMARRLVDLAAGGAAVRRVVAHTLPHASASTRVLEKSGMTFAGEVMDPDDGRVWRWRVEAGG